ncbi:hypothetical protein PR048_028526 [Dryococelus australis]|uniref:Integrase catalytic domain-containing protein n=1 Tax=Dryococelus australis TaxID=614101 RepID=A0ABQ9GAT1_9NEOP|nr:hypothetical protein PR048_028526 [Dryococelus australis]
MKQLACWYLSRTVQPRHQIILGRNQNNWQRIHIDYTSTYQDHHFLVVVDAKSKLAEIVPCSSAPTPKSSIKILKYILSRNGFPEVMVSDKATIFTSEEFVQFCKESFRNYVQQDTQQLTALRNAINHVKPEYAYPSKSSGNPFSLPEYTLEQWESPAEQYLNQQIRIQLDATRPIKFHDSPATTHPARQFIEGEHVSARYYPNNKAQWKCGKVLRKLGKLHYLVELDNGFHFKRHIDQLRSIEIPLPARKTVHFDPQPKSTMSYDCQLNKPNPGDLTEIMDPEMVLPEAEQLDPIKQEGEVPVVDFQPPEQPAQRERPQQERWLPVYLGDYSLY